MEKSKKVKIPEKGRKTGAQRDLERIRNLEAANELLKAANVTMARTVQNWYEKSVSLSLEVSRLNEINDSLNAQLLQIVRTPPTSMPSSLPKTLEFVGESDPSGKSSHEPGAKLDSGKLRAGLVLRGFSNALKAVAEVGTFGANKYTDDGWRSVENGRKRYEDALWRHLLARGRDEQSGLPHSWHALWNMMALIELGLDSKLD